MLYKYFNNILLIIIICLKQGCYIKFTNSWKTHRNMHTSVVYVHSNQLCTFTHNQFKPFIKKRQPKKTKGIPYLSFCGSWGGTLGHDREKRVESPLRGSLARFLQLLDAVSYPVLTENDAGEERGKTLQHEIPISGFLLTITVSHNLLLYASTATSQDS